MTLDDGDIVILDQLFYVSIIGVFVDRQVISYLANSREGHVPSPCEAGKISIDAFSLYRQSGIAG